MITAVLVGAGNRGKDAYGAWALENSHRLKFAAVAEPLTARREAFAAAHGLPPERCYPGWEELFAAGRMADICFIATQDRLHTAPALAALELGYHVLLEKPMAVTEADCRRLVEASEKAGRQLRVAHVLRYTRFFQTIKAAVAGGLIGRIVNINHSENVSYWHFAHSYVRGNWRRADESSPIVLAKTCHDLDLIYWLIGAPALKVSSFGGLFFYRPENAPPGAAKRCLEGCPHLDICLWAAPRIYLKAEPLLQIGTRSRYFHNRLLAGAALRCPGLVNGLGRLYSPLKTLGNWDQWPVSTITDAPSSREAKLQALREGPYGRCVFFCDNDVNDHQVVNMEFAGGATASLTLHGFASSEGRWIRIEGTGGTLFGKLTTEHQEIIVYDHHQVRKKLLLDLDLDLRGHGGGDEGLMESLMASLDGASSSPEGPEVLTSARASLESHLLAFAADRSQHEDRIVYMDEMRHSACHPEHLACHPERSEGSLEK
ncbi:MAG TPA: Gfo/Idh/MocA family oxidoreductase [Bacillota bacterium]|nr:Gfo/Idh/MocA family oxidoreductase [Bacillota bacterium]